MQIITKLTYRIFLAVASAGVRTCLSWPGGSGFTSRPSFFRKMWIATHCGLLPTVALLPPLRQQRLAVHLFVALARERVTRPSLIVLLGSFGPLPSAAYLLIVS